MIRSNLYYWINGITIYRLIAAPFLIYLCIAGEQDVFKWLIAFSFFTDMIDGYLARKFKVTSIFGSRLDSLADDLTIVAAIVGMFVLKPAFVHSVFSSLIILLVLFALQNVMALRRYGKVTSFHTYLAKTSMLFQGIFFIILFFLPEPVYPLFYAAAAITGIELIEEILLVIYLPKWKSNVKGIYWVMKEQK